MPRVRRVTIEGFAKRLDDLLNISREAVWNALNIIGIQLRRTVIDESKLIYAEKRPLVLERLVINGKHYTDITPIFAPR